MEGKTKEQVKNDGMIDTWLKKHRLIYTGATRHPFILAIRDGSVDLSSFKTWLRADQGFKKEASKWDVDLSAIVPQKANQHYCRFLESVMSKENEYPVAITALYAIEAVYQESFAHCLEQGNNTPPELAETCQRWGNDGFGQYCLSLKQIANRCLEKASDDVLTKAEVVLLRIFEHEVEFWNMTRGQSCGE